MKERGKVTVGELLPNYLTIINGLVGALFSGGVQIPEQTTATPNPNTSFSFVENGQIKEYFVGTRSGTTHQANLVCAADGSDSASILLDAVELGALGSAGIQALVQDHSGANISMRVIGSDGSSNYIINALGTTTPAQGISRTSRATGPSAGNVGIPAANTWEVCPLNVQDTAPDIGFSTSTHLFTAPVTGRYRITGTTLTTNGTGGNADAIYGIAINGNPTGEQYCRMTIANTGIFGATFEDVLAVPAGQTIGLVTFVTSVAGLGYTWDQNGCSMSVQLVG